MVNHKYSSYALILFCGLMGIAIVTALFTSGDIDEVCATGERILYRNGLTWDCKIPMVLSPVSLETYEPTPTRASETNLHGGILNLITAGTVDGTTNITASQGVGKMLIIVNTATDSAGTLSVVGTKIDRNTGAIETYTDNITISGLTTDNSANDGNSNMVHNITDAYLTNVWFTGSAEFYSTNLNMANVDIYHVSFEQMNDKDGTVINTFDANVVATHINAEFDGYLYRLIKDSAGKVEINKFAELHLGNLGITPVANKYYRLRRGNLNQAINGTKDGLWVDVHYTNSPAYVEDVTIKVWGTQETLIQ